MSYLVAAPELMASAATDLSSIGSAVTSANAAAAAPTTKLLAAAEDEVSAAVTSLFSSHGNAFQALSSKAAEFHSQFVSSLRAGAGAYVRTEAANASTVAAHAQSALSHSLGKINAAAFGPAATGDATLGPGTYGPGVYADGRVIVLDPGAKIVVRSGCTLTVAHDSVVLVGATVANQAQIVVGANGSKSNLTVGPHSAIFDVGGQLGTGNPFTPGSNFTMGPDAILNIYGNSDFRAFGPVTIDHSEVLVTNNTGFSVDGPVTISQGKFTGYYQINDRIPDSFLGLIPSTRDLVVITKFPNDGTPSVRLRE
jgi:hypothetical protein